MIESSSIDCDFLNVVTMSSRLPFLEWTMNVKIQFTELLQHDNKLPMLTYHNQVFVCVSGTVMMMYHHHIEYVISRCSSQNRPRMNL